MNPNSRSVLLDLLVRTRGLTNYCEVGRAELLFDAARVLRYGSSAWACVEGYSERSKLYLSTEQNQIHGVTLNVVSRSTDVPNGSLTFLVLNVEPHFLHRAFAVWAIKVRPGGTIAGVSASACAETVERLSKKCQTHAMDAGGAWWIDLPSDVPVPSFDRPPPVRRQQRPRFRNTYTVLGKTGTMAELCREFGQDLHVVLGRRRKHWSLERALTRKKPQRGVKRIRVGKLCDTKANIAALKQVPASMFSGRINRGWEPEEAVLAPPIILKPQGGRFIEWNGERKTFKDWCLELGLTFNRNDEQVVRTRINRGWDIGEAFYEPFRPMLKIGKHKRHRTFGRMNKDARTDQPMAG